MAGPSLRVNDQTTVRDLQRFASQMGDGATIHGKTHKDGSTTLYASKAGKGTGLKDYLFGTTTTRRAAANSAITQILFANTKRVDMPAGGHTSQLDTDMTYLLGSLPTGGASLTGTTIKQVAGMAVDAWNAAFKPAGLNVAANGALTGQVTMNETYDLDGKQSIPMKAGFESSAAYVASLTPRTHNGVEMCQNCYDDMPRTPVTIGGYSTTALPGDDYAAKSDQNALELRNFAGSDNAAFVLSQVTNQLFLRPLETGLKLPNGDHVKLTLTDNVSNHPGGYVHKSANGATQDVGNPRQYASAHMDLSTYPNGDFKVTIDWSRFATGFKPPITLSNQEGVPLPTTDPDRALSVRMTTEVRIDQAQAHNRILSLSITTPATTTFDGHLS